MIDLHADDLTISNYADRYYDYLPPNIRKRLSEATDPSAVKYEAWDEALPLVISRETARDKAIGAMVGLAVGDAVGTTLEFQPRDRYTVHDMVGGGAFRLKAGEWTDDTSMALCLAETYLQRNKLEVNDFRDRLVRWYKQGENSSNGICFDIGNTTRFALEQYLQHGPMWMGNTEKNTAGNAALIREAPVAIFRRKTLRGIWFDSQAQSQATHGASESLSSCFFLGLILHYLINGYDKEKTFSPHIVPLSSRVLIINAGEYKQKTRDQIRSSAYVIDTLEAALWAVWNTNNFRDAVLLAANLGDDADSVAATAGQIAGALYGHAGIPQDWKDKLVQHGRIAHMAAELFDRAPDENFL
ncbi:ADP-ribosylglycohydrolase family protein [Kosakonia radicincitans]|uniref:ADP-ribosylarginine hydrolase Tri1 n=1 Tax=Kosakonia radicincitans TaxID=283686 RepID=UPI0011829161|nr:ADP-ribosylarginine hydrolase Tri1 [Kosakonia radicincitans]VVT51514.1 ADP-ribosylglycohydrolase family protein [Kosakonia radicincitans]